MKEGPAVKKSFEFSVLIINYCDFLFEKRKFVVANQLLKSGTSIGANIYEAQYAESRLDFIHKMKIAAKEASETFYWLSLCEKMDDFEVRPQLLELNREIMAILAAIVNTSKKNVGT